ncbi:MFS transporter [Mesorhizobium sp. NPDC059054]|uniref:MFS transporter n=1 Tax=Mesorhizobium sp. NPDC059054 TaxID=3346711 RepID=UPI0036CC5F0E
MTSAETTLPATTARLEIGRKATLLMVATLTIMAGTTISPSLPAIETTFANVEGVKLLSRMVLTLPALFVAFCAPLIGGLADRYGRLRLLIGSILLYGFSGISGLFVESLPALLVSRAALGIAIGGVMTLTTALVGDYFSGSERERYLGLQQAFTGIGGVAFVAAGGILADYHWRAPFAIYAVAFAIIPAAIAFLTEPARPASNGQATVSLSEHAVRWLPVAALCTLAFLVNMIFYFIPSQLPFYLRAVGIGAASSAGFALGLHNLVMAGSALAYGRLRARLSVPVIFVIGLCLMTLGFVLVAFATTMPSVLFAMAIAGAGLGLTIPNLMSGIIALASPTTRGRLAGMVTASMFIGHFTSPFTSQPMIEAIGYQETYLATALGLAALAIVCAVIALNGKVRA